MTRKQEALEAAAVQKISENCTSTDCEGNGCQLDKIICDFLRQAGFEKLADAYDSVECWRA